MSVSCSGDASLPRVPKSEPWSSSSSRVGGPRASGSIANAAGPAADADGGSAAGFRFRTELALARSTNAKQRRQKESRWGGHSINQFRAINFVQLSSSHQSPPLLMSPQQPKGKQPKDTTNTAYSPRHRRCRPPTMSPTSSRSHRRMDRPGDQRSCPAEIKQNID